MEEQVLARLDKIIELLELSLSKTSKPKRVESEPADDVRIVFDHWKSHHAKGSVKLNQKRRQKIQARLREGYDVEILKRAIEGVKNSPFHMGENDRGQKYTDIATIFRDGEQVEKFASLKPPKPAGRVRDIASWQETEAYLKSNEQEASAPPPLEALAERMMKKWG